ncbi:MAG: oligopeptidase A, partial [Zetaproteobacteria bacterium]
MNHAHQDNPLLHIAANQLPAFDRIRPDHVLPALERTLAEARAQIQRLCEQRQPSWDSLMQPLAAIEERIQRVWGPVNHLNAVCDSEELRPVYQQGLALMSEWHSELAQNRALFHAIRNLAESASFATLSPARQQVIRHMLRDFRLAGAELEEPARTRFRDIQKRLSELGMLFEQHVLDATQAFSLHLSDPDDVAGLPPSVLQAARQRAKAQGKKGWLFTLDAPSYIPFMQFADNRSLRARMYRA